MNLNIKKCLFLLSSVFIVFFVAKKFVVFSGEFTSTSATLSNARLSFKGALEGAQITGSSLVTIDVTNYPSESVLQLQTELVQQGGKHGEQSPAGRPWRKR